MRWEWFKNKELGFLMNWSHRTLSVVFSPVNNCFSGKKGRFFFIASWRVMKNGFITATQREESHGDCPVMLLRRRLGWIFTLRRLCCVFGGTRPVLFIMSCWNWTKLSLGNGIERPQYEQGHEKMILQHHNDRPYVAKLAKTYLETLK